MYDTDLGESTWEVALSQMQCFSGDDKQELHSVCICEPILRQMECSQWRQQAGMSFQNAADITSDTQFLGVVSAVDQRIW